MSVDPISAYAGKKAIEVSIQKINELFKEVKEKDKWRVERCELFLTVCSEAVRGLENEYDEILIQAGNLGENPGEAGALRKRITEYLHIDKLRGQLKEAVEGLSFYSDAFLKKSKHILSWPWKRKDRTNAAMQYGETLKELHDFIEELNGQDLRYRQAGTGVGIEALFAILHQLDADDGNKTEKIRELSQKYISERDKEPMFEMIARIRVLIEKLHREFR